MLVRFDFFDREFNFKHDFAYEVELELLPTPGDEVHLPVFDGELPIREGDASAMIAIVRSRSWSIDDEEPNVVIYCDILWERE